MSATPRYVLLHSGLLARLDANGDVIGTPTEVTPKDVLDWCDGQGIPYDYFKDANGDVDETSMEIAPQNSTQAMAVKMRWG